MLILRTLVVTEYSEHYIDFVVDCLCQVRQDKRAAKEKRREEARMREVSIEQCFFLSSTCCSLSGLIGKE